MPATVKFFEELERAFKRCDVDEVVELGVRMLHMGWYGRLDWFLERFNRMLKDLSPEHLERLGQRRFPDLFYVVMYVIRDMRPEKALPYVRPKGNLIERRIFHEYLGNHPRAYHYVLRGEKEMGLGGFWTEIRKLYLHLYRGKDIRLERVEALETTEDELEFVAQIITKSYTVGLYHLLKGDVPEDTFNRVRKTVMYGLSENYDHTTSRLLQVFIPMAVMKGKGTLARRLLNAAISTARTEKNRYMYEWFVLYDAALTGEVGGIGRKVRTYRERGYLGHEVLGRAVLQLVGRGSSHNLRRIKEIRDRYWHVHTIRFAEILTGRVLE